MTPRMGAGARIAGLTLLALGLSMPAWAQTPGTWQEIPNSRFVGSAAICGHVTAPPPPACTPPSLPGGGNNTLASAISAWVDGDYFPPPIGKLLVPRGGGHADWAGNQVVSFDPETGQWATLSPPSLAFPPMSQTGTFVNPYADGTPASVHSYACVAAIPDRGKLWSSGGIYWGIGRNDGKGWLWDLTTRLWTAMADRVTGYGCSAIWDALGARVLYRHSSGLRAWNPVTNAHTVLFTQSDGYTASQSALALDGPGRKLYRVSNGVLRVADLNDLTLKDVPLATTGLGGAGTYGPGLRFDAGRLLFYGISPDGTHGALYSLRPEACGRVGQPACVWTRHDSADGVQPPKPSVNGTWKRFFVHGCDYYVVVNGVLNVWKYRPPWITEACGIPPPEPPPATYPLTVATAGTGSGTVTGSGAFVAGAPVSIGGAPAADSTEGGITPPPCARTPFPMPAAALQCIVTYVLTPPPDPVPPSEGFVTGARVWVINTGALNIRTGPGLDFPAVGQQGYHSPGTVTGAPMQAVKGSWWVPVNFDTGADGYAGQAYLAVTSAPASITLALTSIGSTGAGLLTGAGSYPVGAVATISAAPEPGSATGPVTGDPGCALGPVIVQTNMTCNIPFHDVQRPVVAITTPTEGQVLTAPVPVSYTVTDNRPDPTTTVLLDGVAFVGQDLDPAVLTPGTHQVLVRAVDAAANTGQDTRSVTVPATPPPEADLAPNTWTLVPPIPPDTPPVAGCAAGTPPELCDRTLRAGKHARLAWDTKRRRFTLAGGDRFGSNLGQPAIEALDAATGAATLLSPMCVPAPGLMPHFPDNVGWVYDSARDRFLMFKGYYGLVYNATTGSSRAKSVCQRDFLVDAGVVNADMVWNPETGLWEPAPWPVNPMGGGSDGAGPTYATYDPVSDAVYMAKKDGAWGANLLILHRATNTWSRIKLGAALPTGSPERAALRGANIYRAQPAIAGGRVYFVSMRGTSAALVWYEIGSALQGFYPMPPGYVSATDEVEPCLIHSVKSGRLLHIHHTSLTGDVTGLHAFDLARQQWQSYPTPLLRDPPKGGTCGYEPEREALVIWGRVTKGVSGYPMWQWRDVKE